jgi:arylsulfatase A-like enzyme
LVGLAGGKMPSDRKIDGLDIGPILKGQPGAKVDRSFTPYYLRDDLQAIRVGNWKLHIRHDGVPVQELYNLADDPGESINLYDSHPEQVAQLSEKASECRMDLGDKSEKVHGRGVRPIGRVDHAEYIIPYDQEYPYIVPMYDLEERG